MKKLNVKEFVVIHYRRKYKPNDDIHTFKTKEYVLNSRLMKCVWDFIDGDSKRKVVKVDLYMKNDEGNDEKYMVMDFK